MNKLELRHITENGALIVRTKDDKLADDYWIGKMFLDYKGKTYYCQVCTKTEEGWNIMKMVTHD